MIAHKLLVISLPRQDLPRAVELLQQHDPRELVRESHFGHGQAAVGAGDDLTGKTERAADHKHGAAALLITGFASADYNPISAEEKQEAENVITGEVFWTTFGHKYHLDQDCQAIVNSNTVYAGPVTEANESGRTAICSFCARNHEGEYDFDKLNVEGGSAEENAPAVETGE